MPILSADLKFYRAQVNADGPSNGGRMSANEIADATPHNIMPVIPIEQQQSGATTWRKIYAKVADPSDRVLYLAKVLLALYTRTDDQVYLAIGTQRDTEADLTGAEPLLGAGYLSDTVIAGATTADIVVEDGAVPIYRDGEKVWFSDGTNSEFITLSAAPSVSGNVVTLSFASGLLYGYAPGLDGNGDPLTVIASVAEHGDLAPARTDPVITSAAGTLDAAQILLSNNGAVEEDLTGDSLGAIGSGNIGSDFAPVNPDFPASPLLTIPAGAFGGTWAIGDTFTLTTSPDAIPVWCKRVVPVGMQSGAAQWDVLLYGESTP